MPGTRTEPLPLAGPFLSPPSPGYWLCGGQGFLRAGGQGPDHHGARPLPLTAAHCYGWATAQECFIYLCQKSGCGVQPPPRAPGSWGWVVRGRHTAWPWPSPVPVGRAEGSTPGHGHLHAQTDSPADVSTCLVHTHTHKAHALAHEHRVSCTGSCAHTFTHLYTPTFTQAEAHSFPHISKPTHSSPCTCCLISSHECTYIHLHTMTYFMCTHMGH